MKIHLRFGMHRDVELIHSIKRRRRGERPVVVYEPATGREDPADSVTDRAVTA